MSSRHRRGSGRNSVRTDLRYDDRRTGENISSLRCQSDYVTARSRFRRNLEKRVDLGRDSPLAQTAGFHFDDHLVPNSRSVHGIAEDRVGHVSRREVV